MSKVVEEETVLWANVKCLKTANRGCVSVHDLFEIEPVGKKLWKRQDFSPKSVEEFDQRKNDKADKTEYGVIEGDYMYRTYVMSVHEDRATCLRKVEQKRGLAPKRLSLSDARIPKEYFLNYEEQLSSNTLSKEKSKKRKGSDDEHNRALESDAILKRTKMDSAGFLVQPLSDSEILVHDSADKKSKNKKKKNKKKKKDSVEVDEDVKTKENVNLDELTYDDIPNDHPKEVENADNETCADNVISTKLLDSQSFEKHAGISPEAATYVKNLFKNIGTSKQGGILKSPSKNFNTKPDSNFKSPLKRSCPDSEEGSHLLSSKKSRSSPDKTLEEQGSPMKNLTTNQKHNKKKFSAVGTPTKTPIVPLPNSPMKSGKIKTSAKSSPLMKQNISHSSTSPLKYCNKATQTVINYCSMETQTGCTDEEQVIRELRDRVAKLEAENQTLPSLKQLADSTKLISESIGKAGNSIRYSNSALENMQNAVAFEEEFMQMDVPSDMVYVGLGTLIPKQSLIEIEEETQFLSKRGEAVFEMINMAHDKSPPEEKKEKDFTMRLYSLTKKGARKTKDGQKIKVMNATLVKAVKAILKSMYWDDPDEGSVEKIQLMLTTQPGEVRRRFDRQSAKTATDADGSKKSKPKAKKLSSGKKPAKNKSPRKLDDALGGGSFSGKDTAGSDSASDAS